MERADHLQADRSGAAEHRARKTKARHVVVGVVAGHVVEGRGLRDVAVGIEQQIGRQFVARQIDGDFDAVAIDRETR